ncbi:hypothetical protein [Rhodococcus sp. NPDC049939]|uniref:hypothetical protein n=1 Tax=Rhodococcus sp. NPDC049939 TaxID=3155511 RepID=UPI003402AA1F
MTSVVEAKPAHLDGLGRLTLALLVFDGFLCAVLAVLFLPLYIGATPFPISILAAAVVNLALVVAARSVTGRVGMAALPLVGWGFGFLLCMFGGPGGDALVLVSVWTLLLLVGAVVPALAYLWKISVNVAVRSGSPTVDAGRP